jgi:hypothetical protein
MGKETLTPEDTLNSALAELQAGASPWRIKRSTIGKLKARFRPGFVKYFDRWNVVKDKILRLERYHGAIAAVLQEALDGREAVPREISDECVWLSLLLVQIACPPHVDAAVSRVEGPHCPVQSEPMDTDTLQALGALWAQLLLPEERAAFAKAIDTGVARAARSPRQRRR